MQPTQLIHESTIQSQSKARGLRRYSVPGYPPLWMTEELLSEFAKAQLRRNGHSTIDTVLMELAYCLDSQDVYRQDEIEIIYRIGVTVYAVATEPRGDVPGMLYLDVRSWT